jgi:hypothetical protein
MSINDDFYNQIVGITAENDSNYNPARREKAKTDHAFLRAEAKKIAIKELVDTITPIAMERIKTEAQFGEVDANVYTITLVDNYDHLGDNNGKRYSKVETEGGLMTFCYTDLLYDPSFNKSFGKFKVVVLSKCYDKLYNVKFFWGESKKKYNN